MKYLSIATAAALALAPQLLTAETVELTEAKIVSMAKRENASLSAIAARLKQVEVAESQYNERFESHVEAMGAHSDTHKKGITPFQPVFGPTDLFEVGVKKNMALGVSGKLSAFAEQMSSTDGSIDKATTEGLKLGLSIDLWKNLAGRLDRAERDSIGHKKESAVLRSEIETKAFILSLRKAYWSLVANQESMQTQQTLLDSAKRQLEEAKKREAASVAVASEVARYQAQLAARQSALLILDYQKQKLLMSLKELLPELQNKQVSFAGYDMDKTISSVLQCAKVIEAKNDIPWEFTRYDDVVKLLEESESQNQKALARYAAADLALVSDLEYSGLGDSYSDGQTQFSEDGRFGYSVALQLSVPIGDVKSSSASLKRIAERAAHMAEKSDIMSKVATRHRQMVPLIGLLKASVVNRKLNGKYLETTVSETQKMYKQARVSLDALINDQNDYQANALQTIETKLLTIHELLDYFMIFTETPCGLNQL